MTTWTKSQVNKLGDRLRKSSSVSESDTRLLQEYRRSFEPALDSAVATLKSTLGEPASSRIKTINTIIEKLRREKTRLSEMQDIAGMRMVRESLDEQDELVSRLVAMFPGSKLVDRRRNPSHGYRAVHIIAEFTGHLVEIQVRTTLQDLWAQTFEAMSDVWGRQVRYGQEPTEPMAAVSVPFLSAVDPEIRVTRSRLVNYHRGLAETVAELERTRRELMVSPNEAELQAFQTLTLSVQREERKLQWYFQNLIAVLGK